MSIKRFFAVLSMAMLSINAYTQCQAGEVEVTIDVSTDDYGYEIYWELVPSGNNCGNGTIFAGGNTAVGCGGAGLQNQTPGGYGDNVTITEGPWCLIQGNDYDIVWMDDWGDGGAEFTVTIDGYPLYDFQGTNAGNTFTFTADGPPSLELSLESINTYSYMELGNNPISGTVKNLGVSNITTFDVTYNDGINGSVTETVSGVNIAPFDTYDFTLGTQWNTTYNAVYNMLVFVSNPNGATDSDPNNDTLTSTIEIGPGIPNIIDQYLSATPQFTVIANSSDDLETPRDLDFHPVLTRNELWVINKGTENSGGSTVKISNAGETNQTSLWQQDGNAWHFMSLPTGISFGENENFGTSPGVYDANHDGGMPFTGPSLWSSDPAVYAQPSGGNGSHLDMLHESPYAQGITHEKGNAYWVVDGNSSDIVYYDFADDHGPGGSYHGDAFIYRYADFSITKDPNDHIVSHCVRDKETNWLYVVDHGGQRVMRMDVSTGTIGGAPSFGPHEGIQDYQMVSGYTYETVVSTGLVEPAGIDVIEDRMIVSDHSNGDIIIYDISSVPATELGRINTGASGVMGVKIGPDGKIWYVNATSEEVVRIDATGLSIEDQNLLEAQLYPNPANDKVLVRLSESVSNGIVEILSLEGKVVLQSSIQNNLQKQMDISQLSSGAYIVKISSEEKSTVERLIVR